jgi:stearoyl-CoA desaturase (delta-9 desaturase)
MTTDLLSREPELEALVKDTLLEPGHVAEPHSPARLPYPKGTSENRIRWTYLISISVVHFMALAALLPYCFSWSGVIIMLIGTHVFGSGINIGYHRLLTHRSFKCPLWVERFFIFLAICCLEDAPGSWVATHRLHHKDSDDQPDPHSPWVNFWWSHVGWLFIENRDINNASAFDRFARDILRDPLYMKLQRGFTWVWVYVAHAVAFFAAGFGVGWFWGGTAAAGLQLGVSWFVWCAIVRTVVVWHITWSVNSLSHLFGYRNFETREESRNNWLVAAIAAGEGWHNNHHDDPTAASNWHRWWEFDISYVTIWVLAKLGLAWDVVPRRIDARRKTR